MTRHFCGMWEYKTQIMDYLHTESFLARLILKRHNMWLCICDKNENPIASIRYNKNGIYSIQSYYRVTGLVLYGTYYCIKIDSLHNVSLIPIH